MTFSINLMAMGIFVDECYMQILKIFSGSAPSQAVQSPPSDSESSLDSEDYDDFDD